MAVHGTPPPGAECAVTMDDIDESNYVEYQTMPSGAWHPAKFCEDITKTMLQTGFSRYLDDVGKSVFALSGCSTRARVPPVTCPASGTLTRTCLAAQTRLRATARRRCGGWCSRARQYGWRTSMATRSRTATRMCPRSGT